MTIRKYRPADCRQMAVLFYGTVHAVCQKDYSPAQLDAWADGNVDIEKWNASYLSHNTLVAEENGVVVGFADMDDTGYLDRLYVHKDYQRRGIARALCDLLESTVPGTVTVHASITAKPFFEKRGYRVITAQQVVRHGISLTNFVMELVRDPL